MMFTRSLPILSVFSMSTSLLLPLHTQSAVAGTITKIPRVPNSAFTSVFVTDVSDDGQIVVGFQTGSGTTGFYWTEQTGVVATPPNFSPSGDAVEGISGDGSRFVGDDDEAVYWDFNPPTATLVQMGDLKPSSPIDIGIAHDASYDGSVIVGQAKSGGDISTTVTEAFRWTESGGMMGLGDLPGGSFRSMAFAVSRDGNVVVGRGSGASGTEAFRWTESSGMVGLGLLPGYDRLSIAEETSGDGSVVIGWSEELNLNSQSFMWTESEGLVSLGDLPNGIGDNRPFAITAAGDVIIGVADTEDGGGIYVWTSTHGMRLLTDILIDRGFDLSDWNSLGVNSISGDGLTLAGHGRDTNDNLRGFVIQLETTLVPEPNSLALAAVGLLGFLFLARFRRSSHGARAS